MFHLRVTIEVVNDQGAVVNQQGYNATGVYKGVKLQSTQELWGEGGKPMAIQPANDRLNHLHSAIKAIGEFTNG